MRSDLALHQRSKYPDEIIENLSRSLGKIDFQSDVDIELVAQNLDRFAKLRSSGVEEFGKGIFSLRKIDHLSPKAQSSLNQQLALVQEVLDEANSADSSTPKASQQLAEQCNAKDQRAEILDKIEKTAAFLIDLNSEERLQLLQHLRKTDCVSSDRTFSTHIAAKIQSDAFDLQFELPTYQQKMLLSAMEEEVAFHNLQWRRNHNRELHRDTPLMMAVLRRDRSFYERYSHMLDQNDELSHYVSENPDLLKSTYPSLKNYKCKAIQAVRERFSNFRYVDPRMPGYGVMAAIIIKRCPSNLAFVDPESECYKHLALKMLKKDVGLFRLISEKMAGYPEIALAIGADPLKKFRLPHPELRNQRSTVLAAIKNRPYLMKFAGDELLNDKEFALIGVALKGHNLKHLNFTLRGDREIVLTALRNDPQAFEFADQSLRGIRDIALFAVKLSGYNLAHISAALKNDEELVVAAVEKHPVAFMYAGDALRGDRSIALAAVSLDGENLQYVATELKEDRAIVFAAIRNRPAAYQFAGTAAKACRKIAFEAVTLDGGNLQFVSSEFKEDETIVLAALRSRPSAFQYAGAFAKASRKIAFEAVTLDGDNLQSVSSELLDEATKVFAAAQQNRPIEFQGAETTQKASGEIAFATATLNQDPLRSIDQNSQGDLAHGRATGEKYSARSLSTIDRADSAVFDSVDIDCGKNLKVRFGLKTSENGKSFRHAGISSEDDNKAAAKNLHLSDSILDEAVDELRDHKPFVMQAVKEVGKKLKYASDRLKDDREIVAAAVKNDFGALQFASDKIRSDYTFFPLTRLYHLVKKGLLRIAKFFGWGAN